MPMRGLLSRLDVLGSHVPPGGDPLESITEHLRVLLNARKGQSLSTPGFGILDFNDVVHSSPAVLQRMQLSIQEAIEAFEPRLTNVLVLHAPDEAEPSEPQFEITATWVQGDARGPFRRRTRWGAGGRIELW